MGHLRILKNALYVSAFVMAYSITFAASAKDWEKLPDGRVVLEIGHIKIALVATGDYLEETQFYMDKKSLAMIPGENHSMTVPLKDVVAYPNDARKAFANVLKPKSNREVGFRISFGRNFEKQQTKFQEKFDYSKMGDIWGTVNYTMTIGISDIPYKEKALQNPYVKDDILPCDTENTRLFDKNGLIQENVQPEYFSKRYCLPAEKRLFKTEFATRFHCFAYGDDPTVCESRLLTRTGDIGAYYGFHLQYLDKKGNIQGFSPDKWPELDRQMQEAFSYVIVHSPHGALQ